MSTTLSIARGEDATFDIAVTKDGAVVDLTSCVLAFTAIDADGATISKASDTAGITIASPTTGEATLTFDAGDTSGLDDHVYAFAAELWLTDGTGERTRLWAGQLTVDSTVV